MAYSDKDDYALANNFKDWDEYQAKKPTFPIQATLEADIVAMNSIINGWIGCYNVDITDARFTTYLQQLETEMVMRKHDKSVDRKSGEAKGIYSPHDYLYQHERNHLITIGKATGYRKRRAVSGG